MNKEELKEALDKIMERRPYVDIYYKQQGRSPKWLMAKIAASKEERINAVKSIDKSAFASELIDFEEWLVWYKREERINKILGE